MTNSERVEVAEQTLNYFDKLTGGDGDVETAAIDLMCNIRHLLHARGLNGERALRLAELHFVEEVCGD